MNLSLKCDSKECQCGSVEAISECFFLKKKNRPGGRLFRTKELVAFLIEDAF